MTVILNIPAVNINNTFYHAYCVITRKINFCVKKKKTVVDVHASFRDQYCQVDRMDRQIINYIDLFSKGKKAV